MPCLKIGRCAAVVSTALLGVLAIGCQSGKVTDRSQRQEVRPDGTAVQTRTQTRQTPSGATVKETETRERQVIQPGSSNKSDATKADPSK